MSGVAVHFGAGNIGRGFVGLILHRAGYELVFADVVDTVIDALNNSPSYLVKEVGLDSAEERVDNYRAINSRSDEPALIAQIATAAAQRAQGQADYWVTAKHNVPPVPPAPQSASFFGASTR